MSIEVAQGFRVVPRPASDIDLSTVVTDLQRADLRIEYLEGLLRRVLACLPEGATAALLHWDDLQAIKEALR